MYVLYTTQSRLRISAPFYLIFTKCHFATPTARIYIILFNFQVGNNFDDKKIRVCGFFYFIVRRCRSVDWAPGYNGGLNMCRPVYMLQPVHKSDNDL